MQRIGRPSSSSHPLRQASGFTLVELMVTVSVLAILITIAAPSFTGLIRSGRLSAVSNDLVSLLALGRQEAIRRNTRVALCASANGTGCGGSGDWSTGWILFEDANRDGLLNTGDQVLRTGNGNTEGSVLVLPSANVGSSVAFRADGRARASNGALLAGTIDVCIATTTPGENIRRIQIRTGTQVTQARVNGGGACNTPTNPS